MKWENKYQFNFVHNVVVVVDMQNDFCHEDGAYHRNDPKIFQVAGIREMIPGLQFFLSEMRKKEIPIVFCKYLIDDQARDAGIYVKARQFILTQFLHHS